MSNQSNAMSEPFGSPGTAPTMMPPTRPLYWSVRRELWEYRSIYIAPLAVSAVAILGYLIATMGRALTLSDLAQRRAVLEEPYHFVTALIMGSTFIVAIFYCLDALHGERRDRSILFWKSLPVSDLTTVLAKASIPFVVLPVITIAFVVATQLVMMFLNSLILLGSGLSTAGIWRQLSLFQMSLLYHLVTVHILWYAPIYAWMLLVSGWARRATFLWAVLPAVVIGGVEKIAFNTTHFANLMKYRFSGPEPYDLGGAGKFGMNPMMHLSLATFLSSPGLWLGLIVAAAFLAAAVRLRRYQGPM